MVAPVTTAPPVPSGSPSSSRTHSSATSSSTIAVGDCTKKAAFWSHVLTSQEAASAAGKQPPLTKPKLRPPVLATVAGDPYSCSRCSTVSALVGPGGNGPRNAFSAATALGLGATGRASSPSR